MEPPFQVLARGSKFFGRCASAWGVFVLDMPVQEAALSFFGLISLPFGRVGWFSTKPDKRLWSVK